MQASAIIVHRSSFVVRRPLLALVQFGPFFLSFSDLDFWCPWTPPLLYPEGTWMTARVALQAQGLEIGDMGSDTCEGRWKTACVQAARLETWTFGMATERAALRYCTADVVR